jgi:hypothetical protein
MEYLILIGAILVYFIPTMIGWNKKAIGGIATLNLFLGWTVIVWIIVLVWAFEGKKVEKKA